MSSFKEMPSHEIRKQIVQKREALKNMKWQRVQPDVLREEISQARHELNMRGLNSWSLDARG